MHSCTVEQLLGKGWILFHVLLAGKGRGERNVDTFPKPRANFSYIILKRRPANLGDVALCTGI